MEFFVLCVFIGFIACLYLIANTCTNPPDSFKKYNPPFLISCSFLWIGLIGLTINSYFQINEKSYTLFAVPFILILMYNTLSWFVLKSNELWFISLIFSIIILWVLQICVHNYYYDTDKEYANQIEIQQQQIQEKLIQEKQRLRDIEKMEDQRQYEQKSKPQTPIINNHNYYINGDHNNITINNDQKESL